jgi:1,2-diacylglycerol 3-beta-galactosyltransferase
MDAPTRILIAMSDTGGGHRAMSSAIAGSLYRQYSDRVDVRIEDVFVLPPYTLFERSTRHYGDIIRLAPWLWGWMYHAIDHPFRYRIFGLVQIETREKMARRFDQVRPDVIISTHPLANKPLLDAIDSLNRDIPVLASVSELVTVHTSWVEPRLRLLNTATSESYQSVLRWGADPERVRCVGLPVDERFGAVTTPPEELRVSMGLDPHRFTVLLIGGGEGAGGLEAIVQALQPTGLPVQVIVVCGRNVALKARLEKAQLRTPAFICGFVKTIPELMHAADVVVTKGGPQTIGEALVAGRPIILTETLPGQEEGNGTFVESRGVGFRPGTTDQIVANIERLVLNPAERHWLTVNAGRHGRPQAAAQVAEMTMNLAEVGAWR